MTVAAPVETRVRTFPLHRADDVRGLKEAIRSGEITPAGIQAVIGKTEGEGGPHDDSRIAIDAAIRALIASTGMLDAVAVAAIPMNFSGGSGGVVSPHFTVFYTSPSEGTVSDSRGRLVIGAAVGEPLAPEDLGRPALVANVAATVESALRAAGLTPEQAVYAMVKNPMLTPELIADATARGTSVIDPPTGLSALFKQSGGAALGAAIALGDVRGVQDASIGVDSSVFSTRVSASSGTESEHAQTLVLGNDPAAVGSLRAGHAPLRDALDQAALYRACRAAGLADVPDFAPPETFAHRVAAILVKCNPTEDGLLRGYPQVQRNGAADRAYTSQLKASVGGMLAAAWGNPAFYISGAGIHQGPPGGGSVVVIADLSA